MYKELLNLSKLPFENVPDPDFFYDSGDFSRVLANLTSSVEAGRGLMVVMGAIGSGKTTLSQMVMNKFGQSLTLIWMAEPPESGIDVLIFIARELGLSPADENRVFLLNEIRSALLACEVKCLFILDEAHLMSDEVVNTLKALNNLELMSKKLIQLFLLGQEELLETINRPEMLPFKQRIALLENIGRMERSEVGDYIRFRLTAAGGNPDTFSEDAIAAIAIGSGGVPRVINSLCDKALYHAASNNSTTVGVEYVYEAARGMVDRKEVFQFMLSIDYQLVGNDGAPGSIISGGTDDTGKARQASTPDALIAVADEIGGWDSRSYAGRKTIGIPLVHLALSAITLAASLYFFAERSATGLDGLPAAIMSMIHERILQLL